MSENAVSVEKRIDNPNPAGLDVLTWCFLVLGGLAGFESLNSFLKADVPSMNFLIVFIFVGLGLRQGSTTAYKFAIWCAGGSFLFYLGALIYRVLAESRERDLGDQILFWVITLFAIISSGWALYTLNRASVRQRFQSGDKA